MQEIMKILEIKFFWVCLAKKLVYILSFVITCLKKKEVTFKIKSLAVSIAFSFLSKLVANCIS